MQQIKKKDSKNTVQLKTAIVIVMIMGLIFFLLSIGFFKSKPDKSVELKRSEQLQSPTCNIRGGFYSSTVIISLATSTSPVYYTLDGSEPTLRSNRYTSPITITNESSGDAELSKIPTSPRWKPPLGDVFKGVILRAIAVDERLNTKSDELIKSFFIDQKGRQRYSFPVLSLCINKSDFFGYNKGIYIMGKSYADKDNYIRKNIPLALPWWEYPSNYLLHGDDNERKAHIELFETNGKDGFEATAGIRINGNATRGYSQKSLRLSFRQKYGLSELGYNLFQTDKHWPYTSIILRNAGNDWDKTMFRDVFMQSLMKDAAVDIQNYRPSIVFINGEYWGIHNLQERFEQHYLANKYRINPDSITILELEGNLVAGNKASAGDFSELLHFAAKNDLGVDKNYEQVIEKINVQSFIDFVIANVYFCNGDWPNNNVKFWRSDALTDSSVDYHKWKWMLYDTDWGFNYNASSSPSSNLLGRAVSEGSVGVLFKALITNKKFLNAFLSRFQHHLNETFYAPVVIQKIELFKKNYQPEMKEHIDRWRAIGSYKQWEKNVADLIDFAINRPQNQAEQLNAFFHLEGKDAIVIKR